jgi:hypothetical protein
MPVAPLNFELRLDSRIINSAFLGRLRHRARETREAAWAAHDNLQYRVSRSRLRAPAAVHLRIIVARPTLNAVHDLARSTKGFPIRLVDESIRSRLSGRSSGESQRLFVLFVFFVFFVHRIACPFSKLGPQTGEPSALRSLAV